MDILGEKYLLLSYPSPKFLSFHISFQVHHYHSLRIRNPWTCHTSPSQSDPIVLDTPQPLTPGCRQNGLLQTFSSQLLSGRADTLHPYFWPAILRILKPFSYSSPCQISLLRNKEMCLRLWDYSLKPNRSAKERSIVRWIGKKEEPRGKVMKWWNIQACPFKTLRSLGILQFYKGKTQNWNVRYLFAS